MDYSRVAAAWSSHQWSVRPALLAQSRRGRWRWLLRGRVCLRAMGAVAVLFGTDPLCGAFCALDSCGGFSGWLRFLFGSTLARHVARSHGSRLSYPYLFSRLHVGRGWFLPLFLLLEPVHVFHADIGSG